LNTFILLSTCGGRRGCMVVYNYLCNWCLSPLTLWVWIPLRLGVLDTTLCDKVCKWLAAGQLFSPGTLVSSTNKTDWYNNPPNPNSLYYNKCSTCSYIDILFIYIFQCKPDSHWELPERYCELGITRYSRPALGQDDNLCYLLYK
jgi:hypothetical protein